MRLGLPWIDESGAGVVQVDVTFDEPVPEAPTEVEVCPGIALRCVTMPQSLAWKVMLPLGMVNLVAVAVLYEVRTNYQGGDVWPWNSALSQNALIGLAGWLVFALAWTGVAWAAPRVTDNRAQTSLEPYGVDPQI